MDSWVYSGNSPLFGCPLPLKASTIFLWRQDLPGFGHHLQLWSVCNRQNELSFNFFLFYSFSVKQLILHYSDLFPSYSNSLNHLRLTVGCKHLCTTGCTNNLCYLTGGTNCNLNRCQFKINGKNPIWKLCILGILLHFLNCSLCVCIDL